MNRKHRVFGFWNGFLLIVIFSSCLFMHAAEASAQIIMPIDGLPGYSFYPSDSNEIPRQPGEPRTWYSTVFRGAYDSSLENRGTGSGRHPGVDIRVNRGTPVQAICNGEVAKVERNCVEGRKHCGNGWGNHVIIKHEDLIGGSGTAFFSIYAHLNSIRNYIRTDNPSTPNVNEGLVTTGTIIGESGNTGDSQGPHLHFQIDRDRRADTGKIISRHPYWPGGNIDRPDDSPPVVEYFTYNPIGFIIDFQKSGRLKNLWEFRGPDPLATVNPGERTFDGYSEGWTVHNVNEYSISNQDTDSKGIFYIDPAYNDPFITSPPLYLDSSSFSILEIRMASNAPDGSGAIYFATDSEPGYSEDKKVSFPVTNNGNYYAYQINLGDHPKWAGNITGIRIDPANNGNRRRNNSSDNIGIDYIKLLPMTISQPPWPMFGHDAQHTGQSLYSGPQTPTLRWTFEFKESWGGNPVIGGGGSPVIDKDGTVYVTATYAGPMGFLYAINPDGTLKWKADQDVTSARSPAVAIDGDIYVARSLWWAANNLYAFDRLTGHYKWYYPVSAYYKGGDPIVSPEGVIYMGDDVGLHAINSDGSLKWKRDLSDFGAVLTPTLAFDGSIIVGASYRNGQSILYSIHKETGATNWSIDINGSFTGVPIATPVINSDGKIYVCIATEGSMGWLYSISPTGQINWRKNISFENTSISISEDSTIYVGSGSGDGTGALHALDPLGNTKWIYPTGTVVGPPAIGADGIIYFGSGKYPETNPGDSKIIALRPDGSLLWEYLPPPVQGSETFYPVIGADGTLYVGWYGFLYAFRD